MGAIRLFVDTEAASERERVQQLARDAAETFVRLAEREKALKSKPSSPRASSQAASMPPPSPRDRAATSRLHQQRAP
jgi:Tfp pilus assembly protein PilX